MKRVVQITVNGVERTVLAEAMVLSPGYAAG